MVKRLFQLVKEAQVDEEGIIWELGFLVGQVNTLLVQGGEQELADYPITGDGFMFLAVVKALGDDATQTELTRWMMRRHTSVSTMVQRLQRKGFINKKKVPKPNGKTYTVIELTEKGHQLLLELEARSLFLPKLFSILTFEEMGQLRSLLFKVRAAATQEIRNYEEPPYPSTDRPLIASWEANQTQ